MSTAKTSADQLSELEAKKAAIDAKIQKLKANEKRNAKRNLDRLRYLIGEVVLDHLDNRPDLQSLLTEHLPAKLTQRDKANRVANAVLKNGPPP